MLTIFNVPRMQFHHMIIGSESFINTWFYWRNHLLKKWSSVISKKYFLESKLVWKLKLPTLWVLTEILLNTISPHILHLILHLHEPAFANMKKCLITRLCFVLLMKQKIVKILQKMHLMESVGSEVVSLHVLEGCSPWNF